MEPLENLECKNVKGVFFDIDDTFSTDGKISAGAYSALWKLKEAGKVVVPVTGRPAGWCDHIARMWPVDAVVGENGAFYFMMKAGKMAKNYTASGSQRMIYRKKLLGIRDEILKMVPGAAVASDQDYREFDLAIDYCEDVEPLGVETADKIASFFAKHGADTKISSIHVNGWFGGYDKLTTVKTLAHKELGIDLDTENERFIFCGDSPNDEPMFEYFHNSVGVANIAKFKERLKAPPKFITTKASGEGFTELVNKVISHTQAGTKVTR